MKHLAATLLGALALGAVPAQAALIERANGLVYDDVTNLTWVRDTMLARTLNYQGVLVRDEWGRTVNSVDANGHMTWDQARQFADTLEYAGYDDWRLPTSDGRCCYYQTGSELGYMYYVNLGGIGAYMDGVYQRRHGLDDNGPFEISKNALFWTGTPAGRGNAWVFDTATGFSGTTTTGIFSQFDVWLVRDGDVAAIPEPSTLALAGAAAIGLLATRRRKLQRQGR